MTRRDSREPRASDRQAMSTPTSDEDGFSSLVAAHIAEMAQQRELLKNQTPSGVFETLGSGRRKNPYETEQSTSASDAEPADEPAEDLEAMRKDHFRDQAPEFETLELPTDPAMLRALPTGFRDMTFQEQQEELWVVYAERHLGREWELPDPGKHQPYEHDYPPYSPSKVIGMLHRWRSRAWTPRQWRLARAIAGNRSLRLPVLTAQAWLRRHAILARRRGVALKIERYLGGTDEWKSRLAQLEAETGLTEADIKQWLWILHPVSGDLKLQRFLQSNCRKPLFLLALLLAKDKTIRNPAIFVQLLKYIKENYVLAERPADELSHPAYQGQGRAMTWWHFLVMLYRLVWHCRDSWPAGMPFLSRLTADYIGTMRLGKAGRALTGYQARSLVLNKALQYFSWPARVRPLDHMEHNWAAQRHLLRLAASADPPLVMDQNGYRSVRKVLIALAKTKAEARNVDRAAKTWPPYRRTLDGIDERRLPEDDLTRSAKAGILVREAGYSDDLVDRALSALGGSTFGESPTIPTRSLPPPFFSGEVASYNIYAEWAAQVRATRNAREAWLVFENPPEPDIRPNSQVYAEMFQKLFARPVTGSPAVRPGDTRESFPVHDANLSEFEIARLTPPTPEELYDMMLLHDKIKPAGNCLAVLVRNAPSKMVALRYLSDSPYEPYIEALKERVSWEDGHSLRTLSQMPLLVFNAWIAMLCRLHTRRMRSESIVDDPLGKVGAPSPAGAPGADAGSQAGGPSAQDGDGPEVSQGGSIPEAIELATAFQAHNPKAAHDRKPWHTIMEALAGTKILYSRLGAAYNLLETLMTFMKIYQKTTLSKGADPVSFEALCLIIRKTLKLATFTEVDGKMVPRDYIASSSEIEKLVAQAHRYAVKGFRELTEPVPANPDGGAEGGGEEPSTVIRYNIIGRPLYRYMMALGCCGDQTEMVRVMDWILDGWDRDYIREEAKSPHDLNYHYVMRTFAYFAELGSRLVEPEEMERLRLRLEDLRRTRDCTWFWPTDPLAEEMPTEMPELKTDLVLLDRWGRLRQMVTFVDPEVDSATSLADLGRGTTVRLEEQEQTVLGDP